MAVRVSPLPTRSRALLAAAGTAGALLLAVGCGASGTGGGSAQATADRDAPQALASTSVPASPSASDSTTPSPSRTATATASSTPTSTPTSGRSTGPKAPSATASAGKPAKGSGTQSAGTSGTKSGGSSGGAAAPHFPVPVQVGNATQLITVEASGSYATVTAWEKGSSGWKAQFSTTAGRVGSAGVVNGTTRKQNSSTTPSGTYTLTEGFGVAASGTAMPYHRVGADDWWVEDPQSAYYNSLHSAQGADFPLTEAGVRGSEHLIDHPTQYAEALVVNYNRWPAVPGRGAGIFLHVNGAGATAGCVSVPRATMDRIMSWIKPSAHPRIAIA
ncbi:L,D-transpeptidase [Streptomyces sp. NPDC021224]|uniref:L,D-transpeptidase family protein n=1 Tax=unclassified Streptomyces TaxID=2593676 RepID=UPI0037AD17D4